MQFSVVLKKLLNGFIDVYRKTFFKTIREAFFWTAICFMIAAVIVGFWDDYSIIKSKPISILSYFYSRFSYQNEYAFGDAVKTMFIFFVSLFSINLIRNQNEAANKRRFLNKVRFMDVFSLLAVLVASVLLDCALFRFEGQLDRGLDNHHLKTWIDSTIFFLRIFLPLMLFPLVIQISTSKKAFNLNKLLFLFVSVWLFNEIGYEITLFIRSEIFSLVLYPLNIDFYYWVESLLGIVLISFYFLGYSFAMTAPFRLLEDDYS
jgi:hypothetical protein